MFRPSLCILIIFLKIYFCLEETTPNDFVPRVVNGWPAKLGDVPYQLALKQLVRRRDRMYGTFCGGVIIGPSKVLSAAHCFEEKGSKCMSQGKISKKYLSRVMVVAGNLYNIARYKKDSKEDGQWRQLKNMIYPRRYKFPKNDIAVGFIKGSFVMNEYVAPIPFSRKFAEYSGKCLASGYGRTSNKYKINSEILLLAHLTIVPTSRCSRLHRRNMIKFVCTDIQVTDVSKGDSGGPLVCLETNDPHKSEKGVLVGIVSGSRLRVGTFFTRVSSFSKFIERGKGTLFRPNILFIWFCLIYGIDVLFLSCFNLIYNNLVISVTNRSNMV